MIVPSASQPECLQNGETSVEHVEGESVEISCEVTFAGRWSPVMEWSGTNEERDETVGNRTRWAFDIDALTPEDNGASFTCTTSYEGPPSPGEHEATNAPIMDAVEDCTVTLVVRCK